MPNCWQVTSHIALLIALAYAPVAAENAVAQVPVPAPVPTDGAYSHVALVSGTSDRDSRLPKELLSGEMPPVEPELIEWPPNRSPARRRRITISPMATVIDAATSGYAAPITALGPDPSAEATADPQIGSLILAQSSSPTPFSLPEGAILNHVSPVNDKTGSPHAVSGNTATNTATNNAASQGPAPLKVTQLQTYPLAQTDSRPRILFQPAVPARDPSGRSILRPTVHLADSVQTEIYPTVNYHPTVNHLPTRVRSSNSKRERPTPVADLFELEKVWVPSEFGERAKAFHQRRRKPIVRLIQEVQAVLASQAGRDIGIGAERLPFALFEMDASQPNNNFRIRFDAAYDWEFPDRSEYFWSKIGGKGPSEPGDYEPSIDYQDIRLSFEMGGPRFSATTEIPLRFIDPTVYGNTGGMGDMVLTTKTVMIDGDSLQLTQVLRNQMPTGSSKRGRGVGHVSMEPGFIASYEWSERTLIHNELKLWFPIGGEPGFSGPVLRYGFGFANLLYDSDAFAVIPTLEFVGWSVLSGQKTYANNETVSIDGEYIFNIYPGVRFVNDTGGEVFEVGLSGGASVTNRHWYRGLLRLDLRWTF